MYSSYAVASAVCSAVFPVFAGLAVFLRFRARRSRSLGYKIDDYLSLAALILSIVSSCLVFYGSFRTSFGNRLGTLTNLEFEQWAKNLFCVVVLSNLAIGTVKLSVLTFYKRIFDVPRFHHIANVVIVVDILWLLAFFFGQVFSAWPISNIWTPGGPRDMNYDAFLCAFVALDMLIDIIILSLPIPMIRTLNIPSARKFEVAGVFGLGIFCLISATVKLVFAVKFTFTGTTVPDLNGPFSYLMTNTIIWSTIEPCASVIAACLPTLTIFIRGKHLPTSMVESAWSRLRHTAPEPSIQAVSHDTAAAGNLSSQGAWYKLEEMSSKDSSYARNIEASSAITLSDMHIIDSHETFSQKI